MMASLTSRKKHVARLEERASELREEFLHSHVKPLNVSDAEYQTWADNYVCERIEGSRAISPFGRNDCSGKVDNIGRCVNQYVYRGGIAFPNIPIRKAVRKILGRMALKCPYGEIRDTAQYYLDSAKNSHVESFISWGKNILGK